MDVHASMEIDVLFNPARGKIDLPAPQEIDVSDVARHGVEV